MTTKTDQPGGVIIGHRGVASLALENTMESFRRALEVGVQVVELDVHITADKQFVVCHDPNLKRVAGQWAPVRNLTYAQLSAIKLKNGEAVPLLREVLDLLHHHQAQAIVELKTARNLGEFRELVAHYGQTVKAVASFNFEALRTLRALDPILRLYVAERHNPFTALQRAKAIKASGIDLNFWLLNPLTYLLVRHAKLECMVYTVDPRFLQTFIHRLYPAVDICTNVPQRFLPKPRKPVR